MGMSMEMGKVKLGTPTETDVFNTNNNQVDITNFSVSDGINKDMNSD